MQTMGMLIAARAQSERLVAQTKRSVAKWLYKINLNPSPALIRECSAEKTPHVYQGLFLTEILTYTQKRIKWFGGSP